MPDIVVSMLSMAVFMGVATFASNHGPMSAHAVFMVFAASSKASDVASAVAVPLSSIGVNAVFATVCGNPTVKKVRNLTIMNVLVKDNSGAMQLTFFNMPYLRNVLKSGSTFVFRGLIQAKGTAKVMVLIRGKARAGP